MLVSHRKQFIFLRTSKCASTSVELFLEPWCFAEGEYRASSERSLTITPQGVVAPRHDVGAGREPEAGYSSHMPARSLKPLLGSELWERYTKITIVRNPFDRMISMFYWQRGGLQRSSPLMRWRRRVAALRGRGMVIDRLREDGDVAQFREWVRRGGCIDDTHIYLLDGQVCADVCLRYERLAEDLEALCARLDIPFDPDRLGHHKSEHRDRRFDVRDFYDAETEQRVRQTFAAELERFGYDLPAAARS